jgi:hypothetical protein
MWHREGMSRAPKPRPTEVRDRPWKGSLDPLILEAADEVDGTLLDWALGLSPRERLRACSNATIALGKFVNVSPRAR